MRNTLYVLFFLLGCFQLGYAQEKAQLRGTLVDEKNKTPLVGVVVSLEQNKQSATTNTDGAFIFVNLEAGEDQLVINSAGIRPYRMSVSLTAGENKTLPAITLVQENQIDIQTILGVIDDDVLNDDGDIHGQDIRSSVILSNDLYLNKVGFKLSPFRFRVRGYDNFFEQTYVNGVLANDQYRRVFNFASIGALNDMTRNGDVVNYNNSGNFTFGAIGGAENINMRASSYAKGGKITGSYTNRNYYARGMFSYSTGLMDNGWAFTGAIGGRYADKGFIEGTSYNNVSYAFSAEKQWVDGAHSLSFVTYGSPVVRGQQGASFQEAYDLLDNNMYNPNWGYQDGKVRNSRMVTAYDPTAVLSHIWKIDEKTTLTSGGLLHYGRYASSALNWYNAIDPRPDYYRYLPSYFAMDPANTDQFTYNYYRDLWTSNNTDVTQVNWDEMYRQNMDPENRRKYNGAALYMVEKRHSDLLEGTISSTFNKLYDNNMRLTAGVEARKTRSYQYKTVEDLLGADYVLDKDKFAERDNPGNDDVKQNDLLFPDRKAYVDDIFGYDFDIDVQSVNAWVMNQYQTSSIDFHYGTKLTYTDFQRNGNMKNGRFPNSSYGKGAKYHFFDYTLKGGLTYKINGRHYLSANTSYSTEAPIPDRAYVMPRVTDQVVKGLTSSKIFAADINYIFSMPRLSGRLSVFQTNFYDQLERMAYYHDSERTFVFHNLTGVDRVHRGVEAAATYRLDDNWSFDFIGTMGEYYYSNNPLGIMNSENGKLVDIEEKVYMKDLYVSGTPQFAGVLAARYFYKYWFFEVSANAVGRNYLSASAMRRLASNYVNINPYDEDSFNAYKTLTSQERLDDVVTMDASIGKMFYLKNRRALNFNFSVINLLNNKNIRTGGYEQGRLDTTYPNRFASRYFYMQGMNIFLNVSYRF
ncbi:TonB-dependent receptor [Sphingobacterium spiritivorum ATCC 33300]|uniref:TonB-dependent receptor n=1 Tax=Sphingobacterium spiritivorum ATCC 33300 TaxID=525372 RepID=C2G2E9_SPHSI|nr:TonB-dependent receptor [Sphingobacterium spiritivorum]EEI90591.1 TonB-dependent receptor [Sphingobacterium spiritivorum ATCC 33300]QQS95509.1 TonB-dependent receptor [Sphingobacterium spiritivorum]